MLQRADCLDREPAPGPTSCYRDVNNSKAREGVHSGHRDSFYGQVRWAAGMKDNQ